MQPCYALLLIVQLPQVFEVVLSSKFREIVLADPLLSIGLDRGKS